MNTAIITVKTDQSTKKAAQQLATELGLSLSGVLNTLVKQFVRTRRLEVDLAEDKLELTDYAKKALAKSEEDRKAGRYYSFQDAESTLSFLDDVKKGKLKKYSYAKKS